MRKVKANEPIVVTHPVTLIYGIPGICKTSLAYSALKPVCLDFDNGAHRAVNRNGETWIMEKWTDVEELTVKNLEPFETVVMDTVGRALDLLTAQIGEDDPKMVRGGAPTLQGWGSLKGRFRQWVSFLRTHNKFLVLIAHHKEESDGDMKIVRPDIQGGSYAEVMKIADFAGFLSVRNNKRVLDFNPTDRSVGKNPGQWDPFLIPPIAEAQTFLAERIAEGVNILGKISQENATAAEDIMDWKEKIKGLTTAADMNATIPEILSLPVVIQSQVSKLLLTRAPEAGIEFDKDKKQFVDPKPEKTPPAKENPSELPF